MSEQKLSERDRRRFVLLQPYPGEVEREEAHIIRGPLGIWNFPFLNALLQFLYAVRVQGPGQPQAYFPRTATRRVEYVRDREGRIIERLEEVELP